MLPKAKALLLALLLACRALAVPMNNGQQDEVKSVINALKSQLDHDHDRLSSSMVDGITATLRHQGTLSNEHIQILDSKIQDVVASKGLTSDEIAVEAIRFLDAQGAFKEPTQQGIKDKTLKVTIDLITRVLAQGGDALKDCPGGEQLCGGCVIL